MAYSRDAVQRGAERLEVLGRLSHQWTLAQDDEAYQDIATKFFEHFLTIGGAMTNLGGAGLSLWDDEGNFYYAQLGIERKFLPYGSTTVYGEYGLYDGMSVDAAIEGLETERYGFGVVQKIDSAAMEVYAQARYYQFSGGTDNFEDFSTVLIGSRLKF